ncbi:MAG: hypothetical protein IBJ11_02900 [Phycisphaerales bacterium]|nr:hypothetical protein [Phycisphaerales bacterium]
MLAVLSPYDLAARSPAAMASLLVAERVVTPLPQAGTGRTARLRELLDAWSWTGPLWRQGLLVPAEAGGEAGPLAAVLRLIEADPALTPLRQVLSGVLQRPAANQRLWLDAIALDLLRSGERGPDPGIALPIAAAVAHLASEQGLTVFRPEPSARPGLRRAERWAFRVGVPVLSAATGEQIIAARHVLADTLTPLGEALEALTALIRRGVHPDDLANSIAGDLEPRAAAFDADVAARRATLIKAVSHPDLPPVKLARVSLTGSLEPPDALLRAAVRALPPTASGTPPDVRHDAREFGLAMPPIAVIHVRLLPFEA